MKGSISKYKSIMFISIIDNLNIRKIFNMRLSHYMSQILVINTDYIK